MLSLHTKLVQATANSILKGVLTISVSLSVILIQYIRKYFEFKKIAKKQYSPIIGERLKFSKQDDSSFGIISLILIFSVFKFLEWKYN